MKTKLGINKWLPLKIGIALTFGFIIMALYNWGHGWDNRASYFNGAFIAGFALILVSLLVLVETFGAFEIFSYRIARKKKENGQKETYNEYCERHDENGHNHRFSFIPILLSGIIFLVAAFIIYML